MAWLQTAHKRRNCFRFQRPPFYNPTHSGERESSRERATEMWMEQEEDDSGHRGEEASGELGFPMFNSVLEDDWGFSFSSSSQAETFLLPSSTTSVSSGSNPNPLILNPNPSPSSQPLFPNNMRADSLSTSIFSSNPLEDFLQNPNGEFFSRTKVLQPLDVSPAIGAPPTLFQKRAAALRQSSGNGEDEEDDEDDGKEKIKRRNMPAKNLMAERRRRKKLNDRLFMLRSVVPKISKMDRASILGDAIDYLKELIQKINELQEEFSGTPPSLSPLTGAAASFHPLTPTLPSLPHLIKEELFSTPLQSPTGQLPKVNSMVPQLQVEVREREGKAVNIHMFCTRRSGVLLSTMRVLDSLGLDIQQAVISCFNGFALDIFQAEPCNGHPQVRAEEIKAVLLNSVNCLGLT